MEEAGFQEVKTYVSYLQNIVVNIFCNQAHYGSMSGSEAEARVKGGHAVVHAGRNGFGGDSKIGLGGGMDGGVGGDGYDRDLDGLSQREDNLANAILGTEPNSTLEYDTGLELHHPIMSMLGELGGRLER